MLILLILAQIAQPAFGREVAYPYRNDPGAVRSELVKRGFSVAAVVCTQGADCRLTLPDSEKKDPKPFIDALPYEDPIEKDKAAVLAAKKLAIKWQAGTITVAEKDELLKMLVLRYFGL